VSLPRSLTLTALLLAATVWAATLVLLGLWMVFDGPPAPRISLSVRLPLGAAGIAMGLFVFMVRVADRVFPQIGRRLCMWPLEMSIFLVFILGVVTAWLMAFSGGTLS
jgi:hypothetical protein